MKVLEKPFLYPQVKGHGLESGHTQMILGIVPNQLI